MSWRAYAQTHEVTNQPTPFEGINLYRLDQPLQQWLARYGGAWGEERLDTYGALAGGPLMAAGFLAERNPPRFHSHDRYGHRIDWIEFHPAYHELMQTAVAHGLGCLGWTPERAGAQVVRAALMYLHNQVDAATCCPLTMTHASVPTLGLQAEVGGPWLSKVFSGRYDPADRPLEHKFGATLGMAMTEKQGGTDVRANTTRAHAMLGRGPGQAYELVGHKWFCSAPMSDGFLVLAQAEKGLSCFLLPRYRPDGSRNELHIQRLKDKQGNRGNASAEVELRGALAWMVGEEGRGVVSILEMVRMTRFDCMVGSSALMRQSLSQALHHCALRQVSGRPLLAQPLMRNVLADLALESEAALAMSLYLGHLLEQHDDAAAQILARLLTSVGKYWICKRAPGFVNEAQECLGGAGYIEESILPRLYREAPVNSIWEGSGNVQCLDMLRTLDRRADAWECLFGMLESGPGTQQLQPWINRFKHELDDEVGREFRARQLCERMALLVQARLLLQGPADVAQAFIQARLEQGHGAYGNLPWGVDADALIRRALPQEP